jgi:hypothetical protein
LNPPQHSGVKSTCHSQILDIVSRKWLGTVVSAEETSTQVEVAFTAALEAEDLLDLADQRATAALRAALACGDRDRVIELTNEGQLPLLLASVRPVEAASPQHAKTASRTVEPHRRTNHDPEPPLAGYWKAGMAH